MNQETRHLSPNIKNEFHLKSPQKVKTISKWYYLVQIAFVIVALGVYVAIYFINQISSGAGIISYYYSNYSHVIDQNVVGSSIVPQPYFTVGNVIKSIAFNWIMWKSANIIVILDMLAPFNWKRKLIGVGIFTGVMCAIDWVIFVLLNSRDYDFAFVGISWLVSLVLTVCLYFRQEKQPFHVTLRNSLFPYLSYSTLIVVYWFALPNIFNALIQNISGLSGTLTFFFIFPIIDTLLVLFNWLMQFGVSQNMKLFVSVSTNWLLQGYRVGILCMLSFAQTDLYYQLGWIMFRNVLFNWVTQKSEMNRVNLSMPGWILAYYISIFLNFLPVCGVNNIITSLYYHASISNFIPYLLPYNPYVETMPSITVSTYNITMSGNIQWFVPLLIWIVQTFTQKYKLYNFNAKLIIYNIFGIYLFYVGLISGLGIYQLYAYKLY